MRGVVGGTPQTLVNHEVGAELVEVKYERDLKADSLRFPRVADRGLAGQPWCEQAGNVLPRLNRHPDR